MFNIDTRHIEEREFEKLIGFLGIYTCILSDDVQETTQFMRVYEVSDGAFELPTTVQNFRSIDFMDPNWHRLRM